MSSAIIKMKRGSETDLAEVSKSILDDFKGDVAELSLEDQGRLCLQLRTSLRMI